LRVDGGKSARGDERHAVGQRKAAPALERQLFSGDIERALGSRRQLRQALIGFLEEIERAVGHGSQSPLPAMLPRARDPTSSIPPSTLPRAKAGCRKSYLHGTSADRRRALEFVPSTACNIPSTSRRSAVLRWTRAHRSAFAARLYSSASAQRARVADR